MGKTLSDLIRQELGTDSFVNLDPITVTVGVTAERIARANPNRIALMFVNLSANNIHILPANNPSATHGILVSPSGGNTILFWKEDFDLLLHDWFGIAAAAGSNILTIETLAQ